MRTVVYLFSVSFVRITCMSLVLQAPPKGMAEMALGDCAVPHPNSYLSFDKTQLPASGGQMSQALVSWKIRLFRVCIARKEIFVLCLLWNTVEKGVLASMLADLLILALFKFRWDGHTADLSKRRRSFLHPGSIWPHHRPIEVESSKTAWRNFPSRGGLPLSWILYCRLGLSTASAADRSIQVHVEPCDATPGRRVVPSLYMSRLREGAKPKVLCAKAYSYTIV